MVTAYVCELYEKSVYQALCLWHVVISQITPIVNKTETTVDAHLWYIINRLRLWFISIIYAIEWASALSVSDDRQCESLDMWDGQRVRFPLSLYIDQ